jgi:Ca2+-binding RTX toxin-like protein
MIDGGAGTDTIDFGSFTTAVQISLTDPTEYESGDGIFVVTGFENLTTGSGNDSLIGSSVANILIASTGNDDMTGGGDADKFVFASGDGTDTIQDFSIAEGDIIDLSAVTQFDNFADLEEHMVQVGSNVEISDGAGDKITLADITLGNLTASQFAFA